MGLEAACTVEWQGRAAAGKALLETEEILFRGEIGLRIPRDRITAVTAADGALRVTFGDDTATFALGAAAEKWARALTTVKSRLDKLGVVPGASVSVVGVEDAAFRAEVGERIGAFSDGELAEGLDLVFFGVRSVADLERIEALKRALAPGGALWLIRLKGRAGIPEAQVRAAARGAGLVDVKVASFSATHTAEKYVIPVADRGTGKGATGEAGRRAAAKRG